MRDTTGAAREARKHVTVLFADIVGSTRLVSGLDPEDARHFLTGSIDALIPCVTAAGGVVAKVMGDGVFCVFGAPLAQEDHAYRACHAAMELLATTGKLESPDGEPLQLRIGLSSGTAVVNVTEENGAINLDAIGEVVNEAAHLEADASPGEVLISEATRQLAGHVIDVQRIDGRRAYRLVSVGGNAQGFLPEDPSAHLPFVGRERELDFLTGAMGRLNDGVGDVISVVGGAGLGKSRLMLEFTRQLQPRNVRVAFSSCRALDQSVPHALLRNLVMSLLNVDTRGVADQGQEIALKLTQLDEDFSKYIEYVVWLLLSEGEEKDRKLVETRRHTALTALKRLLISLARREPLIIIIDNFHWSDASSRTFLKAASSIVDCQPLLLVVFGREDATDFRPFVRQALQLRPLDRTTSSKLLACHLQNAQVSESLVDRALDQAEGNPRFLTEFARHLRTRGNDIEASEDIGIPDSIADLFEERIDRLPAAARHLLQLSAAFEQPGTIDTLSELSDQKRAETAELIKTLIDAELVRESGFAPAVVYTFTNPIVGEAAYRSLLRPERQALHQRIFLYIRDEFRGRGRQTMMGRQAYRAGLFEEAAKAYFTAGRNAAARLAYAESIDLFKLALRAEARLLSRTQEIDALAIDIRLALREGLFAKSLFEDIEEQLNEAQAICERIGDGRRSRLVRRHLIGNAVAQGRLQEALDQLSVLIRDNEELGEAREVAELQFLQAQILAALGRFDGAYSSARTVISACARLKGTDQEMSAVTYALSRMWLVWCAAEIGRFEEVKLEVLDCQNDLARDRPPFFRILAGIATGIFWLRFGNDDLAVDTLASVLDLAREDENLAWLRSVASPLGLALIRCGRPEEALPLLQEAVATEAAGKGAGGRGAPAVHLAACWSALGDLRKAEDQARVAVARARQTADLGVLAYALSTLSEILSRAGQSEAAKTCLDEALETAKKCGMRPLVDQIGKQRAV